MASTIASFSPPDKIFLQKWKEANSTGALRIIAAIAAIGGVLAAALPYLTDMYISLENIALDTEEMVPYVKEIDSNMTWVFKSSFSLANIDAQMKDWRPWLEDIKTKTDTIQKSTSSMKIALDNVAVDTTDISVATTAGTALLKLMHQQNTNYLKQYSSQVIREEKMVTSLAAIEATLDKILIEVTKMAAVPFIQKMNSAVRSIRASNTDWAQIDLDACEYDPFGVGPINCEGLEMEGGTMVGVTFHGGR